MEKFKAGDIVRIIDGSSVGSLFEVVGYFLNQEGERKVRCHGVDNIYGYSKDSLIRLRKEYPEGNWNFFQSSLELVRAKDGKEDLTKYMLYGLGCNNTHFSKDESTLRADAKIKSGSTNWNGRIIGYKLVPIFEVETKTILKQIKVNILKKVKNVNKR